MAKKSPAKAAKDLMAGKPVKTASIKATADTDLHVGDPIVRPEKTTRADETPEAKKSLPAKKAAAKDQFAKADAAGAPERHPDDVAAEELRVGMAARGY